MVQTRGSHPPEDEQKGATCPVGSDAGCVWKEYTVEEVPRLSVTLPSQTFPVPMAPIMLSPPPAETMHEGAIPNSFAISGRSIPTISSASIRGGSAADNWPLPSSIVSNTSWIQLRERTSKYAVPEASPYSAQIRPVSQKFKYSCGSRI